MMRKRLLSGIVRLVGLTCALTNAAVAGDLRTPWLSERGPLRYLFEKDPGDEATVRVWTAYASRQAARAFKKHGTATEELTSLIFNKSDFRLTEASPNSLIPLDTEFYNPLLRTVHLHPRAEYSESTFTLGLSYKYPVNENRGCVGVRASVPFRRIEMQRTDQSGVRGGADLQDVLTIQPVGVANSGTTTATAQETVLMRMDFAEALIQSSNRNSALNLGTGNNPATTGTSVGGNLISTVVTGGNVVDGRSAAAATQLTQQILAVIQSPEGQIPRIPNAPTNLAVVTSSSGNNSTLVAKDFSATNVQPTTDLTILPASGHVSSNQVYYFDQGTNYSALLDSAASDVKTRMTNQAIKEQLWLVPFTRENQSIALTNYASDQTILGVGAGSSMKILNDLTSQITENAYEWLHDRGYDFQSDWRARVGDIDVQLFYEHDFNDTTVGEIMVGARVPVSDSDDFFKNPYTVRCGNGGHWEGHVGGDLHWQPSDMVNFNIGARYVYVFEATEMRNATFQGATVKNIGPRLEADIDWQYVVLRADINAFHPDSDTLSGVVGYEFMWKGQDNVRFKVANMQSWLGKQLPLGVAANAVLNEQPLDSSIMEQNTSSLSHKVRFECSLRATDYCELFAGGSYVFAGKNIPQEIDAHAGFHITY